MSFNNKAWVDTPQARQLWINSDLVYDLVIMNDQGLPQGFKVRFPKLQTGSGVMKSYHLRNLVDNYRRDNRLLQVEVLPNLIQMNIISFESINNIVLDKTMR